MLAFGGAIVALFVGWLDPHSAATWVGVGMGLAGVPYVAPERGIFASGRPIERPMLRP